MRNSTLARALLWAPLSLALGWAHAHEGMWMPSQLPQVAKDLKAAGLAIDPAKLTQLTQFPMGAIVSLGGCTASFVSPMGLVVTNHHCAYGSIQFNSSPQRDLLKNGFLAASFADELPAGPGSRVYVTEAVTDVTNRVLSSAVRGLQGKARIDAIEAQQKALVADCEKAAGYRCNVASIYGGLQYQLFKQLEIRDVRLVHAPADMVGRFGGDTDNWIWPRHTGDYSFYRAYVGPDGKPADFNAANQPYRPKHHLRVARSPLNEGDFVMVAGYPGRTNRHALPAEVDFTFGWLRPRNIQAYGEWLDIIQRETTGRRDAEIKLANTVAGLGNAHKNWQGQQASYEGSDILARKQAQYQALKAWVQADPQRQVQFGASLARIDGLLAQVQEETRRDFLGNLGTPTLLGTARDLLKNADQRLRPDAERQAGYQGRDQARRRAGLEAFERRFDAQTDKAKVSHFLTQYLAQPADRLHAGFMQALGLQPGMSAEAVKARVDSLYALSTLTDKAERLAWLSRTPAEFAQSGDPFIAAAVALYADDEAREARAKELAGQVQQAYVDVMRARIAFKASQGQAVYPDANGTLRVSFGQVTGREGPDGSTWSAFSTLRGITAKHQGKGDFDAPAEQLAAIKKGEFGPYGVKALNSVPVNFLATLDTTGGNSGSPVLNRRAELVGLLFDGTLDAVISDWDFNPKTTRSIVVDARYMQWQMRYVDKADRLLKEMGVL